MGIGGGLVAGRQCSGSRNIFLNGYPVAVVIQGVVIGGDHRIARSSAIDPGQPVGIIIGIGGRAPFLLIFLHCLKNMVSH